MYNTKSTGNIEYSGTKVLFWGKMFDKDFYVMNSFGIAHFLSSVIDAGKYVFKAIIFNHVAFVNEIGVFSKVFIP